MHKISSQLTLIFECHAPMGLQDVSLNCLYFYRYAWECTTHIFELEENNELCAPNLTSVEVQFPKK